MIIFNGTKKIGTQSFMMFTNEAGSCIQIPVENKMLSFFLHHFNRLSPGVKGVEPDWAEDSEG
jgi:hypothetical protein